MTSLDNMPSHIGNGESRSSWHIELPLDIALKSGKFMTNGTGKGRHGRKGLKS
jgi:hypothetical protein